ncbi:PQQ-dependent sugar dehydrogenase [Methanolobus sp. WCC5]|jgi:glucose/arabinose dehydrogenase|uniref:PQQ-dependent sugar dehydrogenase n=1 Tax=Methanolobus sp. WCC5 TaxID=3125785 RepID=UPI0032449068
MLKTRLADNRSASAFLLLALLIVILALALFTSGCLGSQRDHDLPQAEGLSTSDNDYPRVSVLADDLEIPWALDFLPDGSIIFTERPGKVRLIDNEEGLLPLPLATLDDVVHVGEGGLLGIAVHPEFEDNQFIYLYYTYRDGERLYNRVIRYTIADRELSGQEIIIDRIPAGRIHNGGRIRFGPDGLLYVCTGDAGEPSLAQDTASLAGKILRLTDTGNIPEDNPLQDLPVYSFGHRNPQGIAWDEHGRLWATEHGPTARDELNVINPGKNYGWPVITGDDTAEGMESPVIHSGWQTWAPSGVSYLKGSVFFTGLRGQSLYEAEVSVLEDERISVELHEHFAGDFGRLRDVVAGPDGNLYMLTNNRDGRGRTIAGDDRMIRVNPGLL